MKYILSAILAVTLLGASCDASQKQSDNTFDKNLKCKQIASELDAQKRDEEQKASKAGLLFYTRFSGSETKYSEKLSTCLYTYTLNIPSTPNVPGSQSRFLVDSLTNEVLAMYTTLDDQPIAEKIEAQKAFYDRYNELYLEGESK